jgi:AcrR family transcriptional regulator
MFGRHGFHATTVPMIVRESGSSTGSFYFYFRDKEDVFAAALESFGQRIAGALHAAVAAAGDDRLLQLEAAVQRMALLMALNPDEARMLIVESSGLSPRLEQIRRSIIDDHARSVERTLEALASVLPPLDSRVVARCWVGSVYESMIYWLGKPPNERPPAREIAAAVSAFNLRGIGAPVQSRADKGR